MDIKVISESFSSPCECPLSTWQKLDQMTLKLPQAAHKKEEVRLTHRQSFNTCVRKSLTAEIVALQKMYEETAWLQSAANPQLWSGQRDVTSSSPVHSHVNHGYVNKTERTPRGTLTASASFKHPNAEAKHSPTATSSRYLGESAHHVKRLFSFSAPIFIYFPQSSSLLTDRGLLMEK